MLLVLVNLEGVVRVLVAELELDVEVRVEVVVWLDVLAELLEDEDEEDVRLLVTEVARS